MLLAANPPEVIMFAFLKTVGEGLVWGFTMALGWIAAFAVMGLAAA